MSGSLIGRYEHLPNRPRSDEARPLLEKIASQVKPIMSKRDWKVGTLAEVRLFVRLLPDVKFLPSNPSLLGNNMNAGQRINLRLRPPGNTSTFYEYDQLVLVMLHELTHIQHGPHDASFYKLLAEIEEEFYELKRKGYSGEGFHGNGNHLSGLKVPEHMGKARGLAAAQKRLDTQRKMGKGGVLGGASVAGKSMKEVLAEAAERRMRDDKACHPSDEGHAKEVEEEVRKAQQESVGIDAVDLTGDDDDDDEPVIVTPTPLSRPVAAVKSSGSADSQTIQRNQRVKLKQSSPTAEWPCPTCTLINSNSVSSCEACASPRPRPTDGTTWHCDFCGAGPREMSFWSCIECGWVRNWG
ncbi:WLM domain-domain-containing protein [Kockovaella imperatae]|uniref:WLM domain-domain-containing protein n=1 Tax=Kockovaella imperatae TaxID=4999 RepID=A0A1Y1UQB1_9TREE|nr:WLM domain-domain-containing protein [Kockovaella imperatae]ORX40250.1 WLM domain-domain-containing protein [Kockovaella imperatae]